MRLLKTINKIPFIELEKGKLYFVKLTSNNIGYKHLRFSDSTITELSTSASTRKKSKRKARTVRIDELYSIVMDMELIRGRTSSKPNGSPPPNGVMPFKTTKELREIISKYINKDGIFPYNKINLLKEKLYRDEVKDEVIIQKPKITKEKKTKIIVEKENNTFSDSTSADRKRKKKKRIMKKKSQRKMKKKKRKKK